MAEEISNSNKPVILYDGWCPFCRNQVERLKAMAKGIDVEYASFRDEGVLERFPQVLEENCEKALQLVRSDGKVYPGLNGVVRLLSRKARWKFSLLYFLPIVKQLGDLAYAMISKNRFRLNRHGSCTDLACTPDRIYRSSERFTGKSIGAGLILGLVGAASLAIPYQWFLDTVPLGFFNLLATLLVAFLIGACIGIGLWWGHGRSAMIAVILALMSVASFEIITFQQSSARHEVVDGASTSIATEAPPIETEKEMPHGRLKVGLPIKGNWLYLFWLGELLSLSMIASLTAIRFTRWPYIEPDEGWARVTWAQTFPGVDEKALRRSLAEERLEPLFAPPLQEGSSSELKVLVYGLPSHEIRWTSAYLSRNGSKELLIRWVRLNDELKDASS